MKKSSFSIFFLVALLFATNFYACKKGDVGPQRQQGPKGDVGAVGPAGKNGSVMYAGTGAPTSSTGNIGDYYLDKSTGNLYGPKTSSGWGSPLALKGATGTTGASGKNGSQILSGNGAPASSLGNTGDYYLDKTNKNLYGPKTSSGWGVALELSGNANVLVFTKNISSSTWKNYSTYLSLDIAAPQVLTSDVVNNWINLVYVNTTDFQGWGIVPYYTERDIRVTAEIEVGHLILKRDQDGDAYTQSGFSAVKFIAIKPSSTGVLDNAPDYKNYNSIARYYGINE